MSEVEEKYSIEFDDNFSLQVVFGACNDNLKIIENRLGVLLKTKGNQVQVIGKTQVVKQAVSVLEALYDIAKKKGSVDEADIKNIFSKIVGVKNMEQENRSDDFSIKTRKKHIQPRSQTQIDYVKAMDKDNMVFGLGPAGTGKTFLAVAKAVELMEKGEIDKIILSRPAVEAGENLGFLPGDLKEKIDPYLRPLYDSLYEMLPQDVVDKKIEIGEIEVAPLAFMRGRTLTNAMIILDEAQNTTAMQMKMFLTRLGEKSKMVINGDLSQTDLPRGVQSGLGDALDVLRNIDGISFIKFSEKDVVRNRLVSQIVKAYDKRYETRKGIIGNDY